MHPSNPVLEGQGQTEGFLGVTPSWTELSHHIPAQPSSLGLAGRETVVHGRKESGAELGLFQVPLRALTSQKEAAGFRKGLLAGDISSLCFLVSSPTNTPTPWGLVTWCEVGHWQASEWCNHQEPAGRLEKHWADPSYQLCMGPPACGPGPLAVTTLRWE